MKLSKRFKNIKGIELVLVIMKLGVKKPELRENRLLLTFPFYKNSQVLSSNAGVQECFLKFPSGPSNFHRSWHKKESKKKFQVLNF